MILLKGILRLLRIWLRARKGDNSHAGEFAHLSYLAKHLKIEGGCVVDIAASDQELEPNQQPLVAYVGTKAQIENSQTQLATLKAKGADTLFLFTTPSFTIKSLAIVTALHWEPTIYLNSVSNPQVYMGIAAKAGAALKNVTSVGYLKDPTDPQWANDAGMKLYKQVIANCTTCNVNDGFNIYGAAVAWTMVDVLKQAGSNMTRANVMSIAGTQLNETTNPFLLPGVVVKTTSSDHFPITQEQVITWSGTGWTLQGSIIDERGTLK